MNAEGRGGGALELEKAVVLDVAGVTGEVGEGGEAGGVVVLVAAVALGEAVTLEAADVL